MKENGFFDTYSGFIAFTLRNKVKAMKPENEQKKECFHPVSLYSSVFQKTGERGEPEEYTVVETCIGRLTNNHECSPERVKVSDVTMLVILRYKH